MKFKGLTMYTGDTIRVEGSHLSDRKKNKVLDAIHKGACMVSSRWCARKCSREEMVKNILFIREVHYDSFLNGAIVYPFIRFEILGQEGIGRATSSQVDQLQYLVVGGNLCCCDKVQRILASMQVG